MKNMKNKRTKEKKVTASDRMLVWLWIIVISTTAEAIIAGMIMKQGMDKIAAMICCGIFCSLLIFLNLEHGRAKQNKQYVLCYAAVCVVMTIAQMVPAYSVPMLAVAVLLSVLSLPLAGLLGTLFHCMVLVIYHNHNIFLLLCYILLGAGGCVLSQYLKKKENRRYAAFFGGILSFGCVLIFSYLQTSQLKGNVVSYGLCNGVITLICIFLIARILFKQEQHTPEYNLNRELDRIISEQYGLVQAILEYSIKDYEHAKRVSKISGACARLLNANPSIAIAAGFYYRLGRMEGEPYVENGVALAKKHHFPKQVITILSEYNGIEKMPSTVESAIIHIVDSVVTKFDVLDKETLSSSWNQDIVVYQTLNENSAAGLYDKAGFSMNMFLKIRDYLIKEAELS